MRALLLALILTTTAPFALKAQWQIQTPATTADLRGIDNVGGGIAWASGTDGTVLRTEDQGYLWQRCTTPPNAEHLDFRGIQAFDANTAIVMSSGKGDLSRLYKTTDGCQTWTVLFTNPEPNGFWDTLKFRKNRQFGWLLGDPVNGEFDLLYTSDGGTTWTPQKNLGLKADPAFQGAFAASNSSLYASTTLLFGTGGKGGGKIYNEIQSTICLDTCSLEEQNLDGKKNVWKQEIIPIGKETESSGIFSIAAKQNPKFPNIALIIVAVGGDYIMPNEFVGTAAFSTDLGKTWLPATTPPHGYRSAVAYDAPTKIWITVGPNGTDISTDDGRNWHPLKPNPAAGDTPDAERNWNALSLPFVVGPHGRIGILRATALEQTQNINLILNPRRKHPRLMFPTQDARLSKKSHFFLYKLDLFSQLHPIRRVLTNKQFRKTCNARSASVSG